MSKTIRLMVNTGFAGAVHEEEVAYDGQTQEEISQLLSDFRDEVVGELEATYRIEEDGEDYDDEEEY
jgi:hypothetical protein